jgi:hypothetical protein
VPGAEGRAGTGDDDDPADSVGAGAVERLGLFPHQPDRQGIARRRPVHYEAQHALVERFEQDGFGFVA